MEVMGIGSERVRWYRSFYFRIGSSFVVFVVAILAAQSAMFSYMIARSRPFPLRSPNNVAAIVAADIGAALTQDPTIDLQEYVTREFSELQPMYLVMNAGLVAANRQEPLAT